MCDARLSSCAIQYAPLPCPVPWQAGFSGVSRDGVGGNYIRLGALPNHIQDLAPAARALPERSSHHVDSRRRATRPAAKIASNTRHLITGFREEPCGPASGSMLGEMAHDRVLQPGDLVPHFEVTLRDGQRVSYRSIWQRQNLVLVALSPSAEEAAEYVEALQRAPELTANETALLITRDAIAC